MESCSNTRERLQQKGTGTGSTILSVGLTLITLPTAIFLCRSTRAGVTGKSFCRLVVRDMGAWSLWLIVPPAEAREQKHQEKIVSMEGLGQQSFNSVPRLP